MYNTNIENNRCFVDCIIVSDEIAVEKFVVDTGAMYTCCYGGVVDENLEEIALKDKENRYIGGLVKGAVVKFYRYSLNQFTIGNIDMSEQDIWITFDKRVTDIILGMDILKQVIMIANPYDQKICFCKDVHDYEHNFQLEVK